MESIKIKGLIIKKENTHKSNKKLLKAETRRREATERNKAYEKLPLAEKKKRNPKKF